MADTYTGKLRLVLQEPGGNQDVWGDVNNNSMVQLVEDSLAGRAALVVAASDVTLTTVNGATDEARAMFLVVTGTLSADVNIIVPSLDKLYIVSTNGVTLDGNTLKIKTVAGTGVTLAEGVISPIWIDGTADEAYAVGDLGVPALADDATNLGGFPAADYARLAVANLFTAGQAVQESVIADGATPTPDMSLSNAFSFRPTGSYTFQTPANAQSGQSFNLIIEHADAAATGSFNSSYKFAGGAAPTFPQDLGYKALVSCQYDAVDAVWVCGVIEDVS